MERSVHSARACFIENLAPVMTPGERAVLDSWYSLLTTNMNMEVDLVIYLRTSPQVALARVQGRSRDEEMQIPEQFFTNMHQLHEVNYSVTILNQTRSRQGQAQEFVIWTLFYGLWTSSTPQGYQLDHSLSQRLLNISLLMFSLNMLGSSVFSLLLSTWFFLLHKSRGPFFC